MNSNFYEENNGLEFLDILTILGLILQIDNMQKTSEKFQKIEDKLDIILNKLNLKEF